MKRELRARKKIKTQEAHHFIDCERFFLARRVGSDEAESIWRLWRLSE